MFNANTQLEVAGLNFDQIKTNLRNFVSQKTEFKDYDFTGSTLNHLLDILSYNTYINSFYTNMSVNETFIDTAQIRANVVSNAKKLGYTPKSAKCSEANITVRYSPTDSPSQIKIPAFSKFTVTKEGKKFQFQTINDYFVVPSDNGYSKEIKIYEGTYITQKVNYDSNKTFYEILNANVDLTTLKVGVRSTAISTEIVYYTKAAILTSVSPSSKVYFLQENGSERYEIYFGNDVLGKSLSNGNVIEISYVTCSGAIANKINTFTAATEAEDVLNSATKYSATSITVTSKSNLGNEKESLESIRFNSQNSHFLQNRLVTVQDYKSYVTGNYSYVQSLSVWGGEDNDPAIYGKVVLSIKPFDGYALTAEMKLQLINDLKSKSVLSIEPIIVDPGFTFIQPEITVLYNSSLTISTSEDIYNKVNVGVQLYEDTSLTLFGNSFKYSNFVSFVDTLDKSINGNYIDIKIEKRLVPVYNSTISYTLAFNTKIKHEYDGFLGAVTSSGFYTNTTSELLYVEDDGYGKLNMVYYESNGDKNIFKTNVGTINYSTGKVQLNAFYFTDLIDSEDEFKIFILPEENNYTPARNQILLFSSPKISIKDLKTNQIVKIGIVDANGNVSPIFTNSVTT